MSRYSISLAINVHFWSVFNQMAFNYLSTLLSLYSKRMPLSEMTADVWWYNRWAKYIHCLFQESLCQQEQLLRELDMYQEIAVAKGAAYESLNVKMDHCQENIETLSDEIQRLQGEIYFPHNWTPVVDREPNRIIMAPSFLWAQLLVWASCVPFPASPPHTILGLVMQSCNTLRRT